MTTTMNYLISIIVPIYNIEIYLRHCIESVLVQTYNHFELILVDDGSTDTCPSICDEYKLVDSRIKVIHKQNGGLTSARNAGIESAQGEWIMHLDGDDWIEPNLLQELIEKAEETNADIIMCDFAFCYESGNKVINNTYDWNNQNNLSLRGYLETTWTPLCMSIQRKYLYDKYNLKSPDNISYLEDFHLMTRLCFYANKISKVNKPLYNYRQQEESIMHTFNEKCTTDGMSVYNDIIAFFKDHFCYEEYKEVMGWRSLRLCLDMIFDPAKYNLIKKFNPDKKHFIFSCPFNNISLKAKLMLWCITHGMTSAAKLLLSTRNIVK